MPAVWTGGAVSNRRASGKMKELETFTLFKRLSMEAISHGVGSQVSAGYSRAHCFLEIKLIGGEMIKNVENGCQRGESPTSGAG